MTINKKSNWTDALPKATDKVGEIKVEKVERLNADGTTTDITDKPEEWFPEPPTITTRNLSEQIFDILDDKIHLASTYAMYQMREAAKELELLFLQSQVDLLNEITVGNLIANPVSYVIPKKLISDKITELKQQINNLESSK